MKKIISKVIFLVGLIIFMFPFVLRIISYFNQTTVISNYNSEISNLTEEEKEQKKNDANDYNSQIADEKPTISIESDEFVTDSEVVSSYDFLKTGEVIGTLIIPKIGVNLPIYDGVTENNLQKGVALLEKTSYPTGEVGTHSVIAGHSGLTSAKLLDDIDQLVVGDIFQIDYLNEVTSYEVIDIQIVLPDETESLSIKENETLVTLVTCTPKGINTHRLLVTAQKTTIVEEEVSTYQNIVNFVKSNWAYIVAFVLVIIFIVVMIVVTKKNKKIKS